MDWLAKHPAPVILGVVAAGITIWSAIKNSPFWMAVAAVSVFSWFVYTVYDYRRPRAARNPVVIPESQPAAASNPPAAPPAREKRRMQCRFCNGTGRITAYQDRYTTRNIVCEICNGHGDYLTDLWSQPDCAYCGGTARVVTDRTLYRITEVPCGICGGTGKRPFDI